MVGFPTVYDCEVVAVSPNYLEVYVCVREGWGGGRERERRNEERREKHTRNLACVYVQACMCGTLDGA